MSFDSARRLLLPLASIALVLLFVAGCGTTYKVHQRLPVVSGATPTYEVVNCEGKGVHGLGLICSTLTKHMEYQLLLRGLAPKTGDLADRQLNLIITRVNRVSQADRFFLGWMAGEDRMDVTAETYDRVSEDLIGLASLSSFNPAPGPVWALASVVTMPLTIAIAPVLYPKPATEKIMADRAAEKIAWILRRSQGD